MDYTITLSKTENDALAYAAVDTNDWIQNVVHERCRIAIDEIAQLAVAKCFETNVQVPNSKNALVDLAFEKGWAKSLAQVEEERVAK